MPFARGLRCDDVEGTGDALDDCGGEAAEGAGAAFLLAGLPQTRTPPAVRPSILGAARTVEDSRLFDELEVLPERSMTDLDGMGFGFLLAAPAAVLFPAAAAPPAGDLRLLPLAAALTLEVLADEP